MASTRPYLIRAIHAWATDHGFTPHLLVNATFPGVEVPSAHVQDGKIVLNIHSRATQGLELGDHEIRFEARFGGVPLVLAIPIGAVEAIYARENGQGLTFGPDPEPDPGPPTVPSEPVARKSAPRKGPHLKVVK